MQDEIKVWLEDITRAIVEINEFLPDTRNFKQFEKDLKTKRAVEPIVRGDYEMYP